jgi:two-component system CheB/CheR fusion protein
MQASPMTSSFHPLVAVYQLPSRDQFPAGKRGKAAESEAGRSESPEQQQRKPRALVVDDAPDVAEMLAMFLRHAGYEPVMAFNAPEALEAARLGQFDLVVSDIGMPGMDGYELAVALRELPSYRTVPMIAVTGFSMYDDLGRALKSGFNAHLPKPINPTTLLQLIERLRD